MQRRARRRAEAEALRRSLYSREPDPRALARVRPHRERPARRLRLRLHLGRVSGVLAAAGLLAAGAAAVLVVAPRVPPQDVPLPERLEAPVVAGTVLASWSGVRGTDSDEPVGYQQPSGFSVVRPAGRTVHVVLRCAGTGRIVIDAGHRFAFRCAGPDTTTRLDDDVVRDAAFIVEARSEGDVVWAATVVARP